MHIFDLRRFVFLRLNRRGRFGIHPLDNLGQLGMGGWLLSEIWSLFC